MGATSDVVFNPTQPHLFAVGCDDPYVRLYDLRMTPGKTPEPLPQPNLLVPASDAGSEEGCEEGEGGLRGFVGTEAGSFPGRVAAGCGHIAADAPRCLNRLVPQDLLEVNVSLVLLPSCSQWPISLTPFPPLLLSYSSAPGIHSRRPAAAPSPAGGSVTVSLAWTSPRRASSWLPIEGRTCSFSRPGLSRGGRGRSRPTRPAAFRRSGATMRRVTRGWTDLPGRESPCGIVGHKTRGHS